MKGRVVFSNPPPDTSEHLALPHGSTITTMCFTTDMRPIPGFSSPPRRNTEHARRW